MERVKVVRGLRIAWSVWWGILCVLLIALWVRSYWRPDIFRPLGHEVWVSFGRVISDETWVPSSEPPQVQKSVENQPDGGFTMSEMTIQTLLPAGTGTTIPIWVPTMVFLILGAIPWLPRRFSLRTLLIVTTLIAVLLGLVMWSRRI